MDIVGKEIRAKCVPEIDEYADCIVGRTFTMLQCKPAAITMRRSRKHHGAERNGLQPLDVTIREPLCYCGC